MADRAPVTFPMFVQNLLQAEGVEPFQPAIPDELVFGRFGWSLEQAQGTTATLAAGQIIDFTADTGPAGTVARIGHLLNSQSTASNPKVVAFPEHVSISVSASAGALTEDFINDLQNSLYIGWAATGAKLRPYSLVDGVSTFSFFQTSDGASQATITSTVKAYPVEMPGCVADLEYDTWGLYAENAIALPTGATVKLNVKFDGALYGKANGDIPRNVGAQGCRSARQDKAVIRRAKTRAMMALRPAGSRY